MNDRLRNIEPRMYRRGECVTFRKTNEEFGGLSNMAPGFPLFVNGLKIGTSEVLYQACRFPHLIDVQRMLLAERSPMTAKMKSKPFRGESRADFEHIKVTVMRWCLRVKLLQNWRRFERLLLATGERPIVEVSQKDPYWGAQPDEGDALIGGNVMGRLLMEVREQLRSDRRDELRAPLPPPPVFDFLLLGMPIGIVTEHQGQPSIAVANGVAASPTGHADQDQPSVAVANGAASSPTGHADQDQPNVAVANGVASSPTGHADQDQPSVAVANGAASSPTGHADQDQPSVAVANGVAPSPTGHADVVVRLFVSYYGHPREIGNARMQLSAFVERLVQLWGQNGEPEEVELTVKCRPGTEERATRILRGLRSDSDRSDSDEKPQLELFARVRYD